MDILISGFLGIVQGLTEFLPISSTAHLVLLEKVLSLNSSQFGLSFDIALHIGTLIAVLAYFRRKLLLLVTHPKNNSTLIMNLTIGTIPAVIIGLLLEEAVSGYLRNPLIIAASLIVFSFVFALAEKITQKTSSIASLKWPDALIIGTFQSIAFIPGVSRSGITMTGGLVRNLKKEEAAEFAFLLSVPIITLAALKDTLNIASTPNPDINLSLFLLGALMSSLTGFFCIKYFLNLLKRYGLMPYIIYRILLGLLILILI